MPISEEAERLANIDALIAEWKRTPDTDHAAQSRISLALNTLFTSRATWQRKHKASYNYALSRGLIKRVRSPNGAPTWFKMMQNETRIGAIAKYRDELHHRLSGIPGGMAIEREAGEVLRQCNQAEFPVEHCIKKAEERVDHLLRCRA